MSARHDYPLLAALADPATVVGRQVADALDCGLVFAIPRLPVLPTQLARHMATKHPDYATSTTIWRDEMSRSAWSSRRVVAVEELES